MSDLPTFDDDDELTAWFQDVDLDELQLVEELDVNIATHVEVIVSEPWPTPTSSAAASSTGTRRVVLEPAAH